MVSQQGGGDTIGGNTIVSKRFKVDSRKFRRRVKRSLKGMAKKNPWERIMFMPR